MSTQDQAPQLGDTQATRPATPDDVADDGRYIAALESRLREALRRLVEANAEAERLQEGLTLAALRMIAAADTLSLMGNEVGEQFVREWAKEARDLAARKGTTP